MRKCFQCKIKFIPCNRFEWSCDKCKRDNFFKSRKNYHKTEKYKKGVAAYHKKYAKNNREKLKAHQLVFKAVKIGYLIKLPCHVCDNPHSEAHHEDYSKPLEVHWLCPKHHKQRHREIGEL